MAILSLVRARLTIRGNFIPTKSIFTSIFEVFMQHAYADFKEVAKNPMTKATSRHEASVISTKGD